MGVVGSLEDGGPAPAPTGTAVIVALPAAEPVVGVHRQRLDSSAPWGIPAHITVLYPFLAPEAVDDAVVAALAEAVRSVPAFDCRLVDTAWFDRDVLWLRPDPAEPFRRLTGAVWRAFPDSPPYAGEHDGDTPHLTVGERAVAVAQGLDDGCLQRAEAQVRAGLPLHQRVDHALLVAGSPAPRAWRTLHRLPLG